VFRLSQNVPNPFNPKTVVAYEVPQTAAVEIRVYDVTGRAVRTLVDGTVEPGRYAVTWDGRNDAGEAVGSGVYFCVMDTPAYHATNKMMLLK
jgi:flagellar hook assembly protein FlgD